MSDIHRKIHMNWCASNGDTLAKLIPRHEEAKERWKEARANGSALEEWNALNDEMNLLSRINEWWRQYKTATSEENL